jgi:GNAT superfamily N-acetyltransferase
MATEPPLLSPIALDKNHDLAAFDCGAAALNDYLRKYAYQNHQNRSARTYVAARGNRVVGCYVVGCYTLAAGSVHREDTPPRVAKGLGIYPVPIILLARLAVDRTEQGKGLGTALLKDAILRVSLAADNIGCRAVLSHAKDQEAQAFARKFGFRPSPMDQLMKDSKASLGTSR